MTDQPLIVGVVGASGSGKTHLLQQITQHFQGQELCVISQDNYYKPRELQQKDENGVENFDLPTSIDIEKFSKDLSLLIKGESITIDEYTFNNDKKTSKEITLFSAPIIIVEGIFVFHFEELFHQLDYRIFVDVKESSLMKRRILRDKVERGYELDDVLYRYEHHVVPAYEKYILPHKDKAHIIVPSYTELDKSINILVAFFKTKL